MKKALILLYALTLLTNCQYNQIENSTSADTTAKAEAAMVGNDMDKHGCKGSAGYKWSVVKNKCVRIFEAGVRLDSANSTLDQSISAFVIFANDEKENEFDVEIFLPSLQDRGIVLKPIKDDGAGTWSNGSYTLSQWKGMYSLEEGKKTLYQGHR